jgi:hypothetical protein
MINEVEEFMKIQIGRMDKKRLGVMFLLVGLLSFTSACTIRSTTTYIKAPLPEATKAVMNISASASCFDAEKIIMIFNSKTVLNEVFDEKEREIFTTKISEIITEEKLDCSKDTKGPKDRYWKFVGDELIKHHEGLLYKVDNEEKYKEEKEKSLDKLKDEVGESKQISVSYAKPGSLSLSTRTVPSEQEPGGSFANMKERAQAAIIDFAKEFAENKKGTPEEEAKSLLDTLSRPDEPRFAETRKVELTISTLLNSASVDDRFDYITAYLSIPPLPGCTNGKISLEREFLRRFQAFTMGRLKDNRGKFIEADIRRALDALKVRIEVVDSLKTEASSIQLGKLTSGESLDMTVGQTAVGSLKLTGVTGKISASREDNISKELDKRSFWIDSNRSLLRITQRGMQEATISGSFSSAITLRIPKTNLYVIEIGIDKDKKKVDKVKLKDIEQPLYASVDAIGEVLGTVRVAKPFKYSTFKKEAHGVAYTVSEEPMPLKLWRHDRILHTLAIQELVPASEDLQKLFPSPKDKGKGYLSFGIYSTVPYVRQAIRFKEQESWGNFIEALEQKKLFLAKKQVNNGFWYVILPCPFPSDEDLMKEFKEELDKIQDKSLREAKFTEKRKDRYEKIKETIKRKREAKEPEPRDIWLGFEDDDGVIKPLFGELPLKYSECECPKAGSQDCKID